MVCSSFVLVCRLMCFPPTTISYLVGGREMLTPAILLSLKCIFRGKGGRESREGGGWSSTGGCNGGRSVILQDEALEMCCWKAIVCLYCGCFFQVTRSWSYPLLLQLPPPTHTHFSLLPPASLEMVYRVFNKG